MPCTEIVGFGQNRGHQMALGIFQFPADLWNRVWKRARPQKELSCSQGISKRESKEQGHPSRLFRQAGDADALGEGRTNPAMGIHEHLPRLEHLGSTTAVQGIGQTLNMTLLPADIKQWLHQHTPGALTQEKWASFTLVFHPFRHIPTHDNLCSPTHSYP